MSDHPSLSDLKRRISTFVQEESPGAIHIHGDWGVGKTFGVLEALKAPDTDKQVPFSYISLFGISTLSEVYMRLTLGMANKVTQKIPDWIEKLGIAKSTWRLPNWVKKIGIIQRTRDTASGFLSSFIGKERMDTASASITGLLAYKMLIVIDDLERRSPDLELKAILGVISYLVESRECKVIFISNDGKLSVEDKNTFNTQKEKIFDYEIPYSPKIEENASIFAKNFENVLTPILKTFDVNNLRVINRTVRVLERVASEIPDDLTFAKKITLESSAKFAVLHFGFREKVDISNFVTSRPLGFMEKIFGDDEKLSEGDKLIVKSKIEFTPCNSYIVEAVKTGNTDWDSFLEKIQALNSETAKRHKNSDLQSYIRSLLESFLINDPDIAVKLREKCEGCIPLLNPETIDWVGEILVELGESDPRDQWFQQWEEVNIQNLSDEEIRHALTGFSRPPQGLLAAYKSEAERRQPPLDMENILLRRFTGKAVYQSDIDRIAGLPDEQYVVWLRSSQTDDFRMLVREVFENFYGKGGSEGMIAEKTLKAAELLAGESKLNALRVKYLKSALPKRLDEVDEEIEADGKGSEPAST